jgi:hypothetical protein
LDVDDKGVILIKHRHQPTRETRARPDMIKVNDRVKSLFMVDKKKQYFEGTVKKINKATIRVDFDDGNSHLMKREELELIK